MAQFLRRCRERTRPADLGLPSGARRRTPGLRREEIAVLAGLSPTWYTYLEQGRDIRPSTEVLASLARVLRLSNDERTYLYLLATGNPPSDERPRNDTSDDAVVSSVVARMAHNGLPVYAADIHGDIVAWNDTAVNWYTDFGALPDDRRNMLWWMLTAPEARDRFVNWEEETRDVVGRFRRAAAARAWDARFEELTGMMRDASPEFREWWSSHYVSKQRTRLRELWVDGELRVVQLAVLNLADSTRSVVLHLPPDETDATPG
ncbi:helix-turn-helix transcriptional regulator [Saccharothrix sp. ALI-22-I]|uniref:helix-turn-helix transcriptional regulator n=1 Tax=Saccharothrix sp. ALI-22-I TaxID=1933778 RepID=UPI001EE74D71|nr:helix-turn-helix transcriptional regulator [Saccharothrix sp. ALI-22-I]